MEQDLIIEEILEEYRNRPFTKYYNNVLKTDKNLFYEYGSITFYYTYQEESLGNWTFKDKYYNDLGLELDNNDHLRLYFSVESTIGEKYKIYDDSVKIGEITQDSIKGTTDEFRYTTFMKILVDEIIPRKISSNQPFKIIMSPINKNLLEIYKKCEDFCKEKYPQITITQNPGEIQIAG